MPLLITAFAGAVAWFLVTPYARYALPLLPLLCGLSAMNVVMGYDVARRRLPRSHVLPAAALTLAVTYLGATRLVTTASVIREPERYPVSVAFGREPPATFMDRHLDEMPAIAAMQANAAVGNVLSLGMPHGLYYGGTLTEVLDFSPRFRYLLEIDNPETLLAELHERGDEYVLVQWSSASRFLTKSGAPSVSDGSGVRDPSAVPLLLSHSRFLAPYLDEIFSGNGISVFAIPVAGGGSPAADLAGMRPQEERSCRSSAQKEKRGKAGTQRQPCVAVVPEPVFAGLGRGSATVYWTSGAMANGELVLGIDGETEIPLDVGDGGVYELKQLEPGFNYVVRLYVADENGRLLAAESPVRVWTD